MIVSFTVPGQPVAKGRPRFGNGRTYTPSETIQQEAAIRTMARAAMRGRSPNDVDHLALTLVFRVKGAPKQDIDNYVKLVLDAGNRFLWRDDAQVKKLDAEIVNDSPSPATEISVSVYAERGRDCPCGKALTWQQVNAKGTYCSTACARRLAHSAGSTTR